MIKNEFHSPHMDNNMKTSAGVLIVLNKSKVLLCHPTNASWTNTYSPPKGETDLGEDLIKTAIRECFEETGITISESFLKKEFIIDYTKGKNVFKRVHLFLVEINSLSDIGLVTEIIDKEKLQLAEVDWCGFLDKKDAEVKIFWRFKHILYEILN